MDAAAVPPMIPLRNRQHSQRQSVPGPPSHARAGDARAGDARAGDARASDANRVHVQPASPEVISSLITSLSIISTPASDLFDPSDEISSLSASSNGRHASLSATDRYSYSNGANKGGSFGVDYGAFKQPSLEEVQDESSLDELAASPPVIRTAKPPSGFSSLTAPKSPTKDANLKALLHASSRPSSKGSNNSKDHDEVSSIGSLSIEPGAITRAELRRISSSDSWGKKQHRNSKGLMYMSSKERLRETERRRASTTSIGGTKGPGIDRLPPLQFDADSFLAERPISEETNGDQRDSILSTKMSNSAAASPKIGSSSPELSNGSQGGIASPRHIPTRDSSLRKTTATPISKKRTSHRLSRQNGKQREEDGGEVIKEVDEQDGPRRERVTEKKRSDACVIRADSASKLQEPLKSPSPDPSQKSTLVSKDASDSAKVEQRMDAKDMDDGAPSPAVAQRKSRTSGDYLDSIPNGKNKRTGRNTAEPLEGKPSRRDLKLKRLSAPLSPTGTPKDSHQRSASQPLSRKEVTSPEPTRPHINLDDRASSADSIDDAVESYLCSHRLSQKIHHPLTGRTISFSEVGDPEGYAVFCCVGMGLTRYITAFYDELALTLKLRLITPDRPGVGDSEAYTDGTATPLSWPGM
jgi:hypothetical protein